MGQLSACQPWPVDSRIPIRIRFGKRKPLPLGRKMKRGGDDDQDEAAGERGGNCGA